MKTFLNKLSAPPKDTDVLILAVFTALITWNPYFANGKINLFEVGLYLPGIQAILNGEIPFRDFFHLRGPFELYMPAFLMKVFGVHLKTLYSYFYFGNVLCLILCVLIARELLKTRLVLYLFTLVLVGRTWPRVVFTYWGGMRYAFGLLAVWLIIKFFREDDGRWMFAAGAAGACAALTSIEMGVYPVLGAAAALLIFLIFKRQDARTVLTGAAGYAAGMALVAVPYGAYLAWHGALLPYLDGVWTIVTRMQIVIDPHFVSEYPRNFIEALAAMLNPDHTNFKHMTPSYLYIIILVYLIVRARKNELSRTHLMIVCLGVYGFIMYNTGFRGIWAAQFEMALQPEKILLFYLLEVFMLLALAGRKTLIPKLKRSRSLKWYSRKKWKLYFYNAFLFVLVGSSVGYAVQRYNHRFYAFKFVRDKLMNKDTARLMPLAGEESRPLRMERALGIEVPVEQADELEGVKDFVDRHLTGDQVLFTYPELGTYNFLVDRRFFGKFPLSTFSWFNDRWHEDYLAQLKSSEPEYIVMPKTIEQRWKDVYLARDENLQKFRDVMDWVPRHYKVEAETALSRIYRLK